MAVPKYKTLHLALDEKKRHFTSHQLINIVHSIDEMGVKTQCERLITKEFLIKKLNDKLLVKKERKEEVKMTRDQSNY